jgi:hypothetical protein
LDGAEIALHVALEFELGELSACLECEDRAVIFIKKAQFRYVFWVWDLAVV